MNDLISRQLLISKLANSTVKFATYDDWEHCCDVIQSVEREKGEWKREVLGSTSGYGTTVMYQCSECERMAISQYNFCPNCGADMRGEKNGL